MKLATFEVRTPLGRRERLGAMVDGRIVDLNFAYAWYMAQQGEPDAQALADAHLPADLPGWLRAGERALHSSLELFEGAGPTPARWWKEADPPRGPGEETLVHSLAEVRLRAPLPAPAASCGDGAYSFWRSRPTLGPDEDVPWPSFAGALDCRPRLAAVIGKRGAGVPIAGFTAVHEFLARDGGVWRTAMGPWLATPEELGNPIRAGVSARLNGEPRGRSGPDDLRGAFDRLTLEHGLAPGDVVLWDAAGPFRGLAHGDVVELEIESIGVLRNRVA